MKPTATEATTDTIAKTRWVLTFDVGGTFTDLILYDRETGQVASAKVPTVPDDMATGIGEGARRIFDRIPLDADGNVSYRGATTLVANLIHERKGGRIALLTTRGFTDLLRIRREYRYDLYDLFLKFPEPLVAVADTHEVDERIAADGTILVSLDDAHVAELAAKLEGDGLEGVAVCLLHSYMNSAHEEAMASGLHRHGFGGTVSLSSRVVPEIREYERASTAVANAYVMPRLAHQIARTGAELSLATHRPGHLHLMLSNGGFSAIEHALEQPIQLVESGPAAGVVAAGRIRRLLGADRVLSFEMGGTTAKISLLRSEKPDVVREVEVARVSRFRRGSGIPLQISSVDLLEIGAGGGSIAQVDRGRLLVGPESAGAIPGPACYGRGGTRPTVTDADLVLGYLDPNYFLGGEMVLDRDAAELAIAEFIGKPLEMSVVDAASAVRTIADESLAVAARVHLAERGEKPDEYTMVAFGGAGAIHFERIASRLGIRRVVIPELPGVAGAVGLVIAPVSVNLVRSYFTGLGSADWNRVNGLFSEMEDEATALLARAGARRDAVDIQRFAEMRYTGQGYEIAVAMPSGQFEADAAAILLHGLFEAEYRRRFSRELPGMLVEVMSWRVEATAPPFTQDIGATRSSDGGEAQKGRRSLFREGRWVEVAVHDRYELSEQDRVFGPAIIEEKESTIWVPEEAEARVGEHGQYVVIDL